MKHLLYALTAAFLMLTGCTKNNDANNGGGSSDQLLPASTGWKTISSVHYGNFVSGFEGENAMTPYDMTMVGNELALLYSDDYKMSGVDGHIIMKMMMANGSNDAKTKATRLNYDRGGNAVQIHRFIPESYNTLSGRFQNNEIILYDEKGGPNASQDFGSINALPTLRWAADGSILAGLLDGPHSTATWTYQYPTIGNFNYVINEWNGDSTRNVVSSPFKLNDGQVYDMVFSQKNGTMYFSVLKNLNAPQTGSAPNYQMICRNAVPSLDGNKGYAVVTSDVQGDATMIMLAEGGYINGNVIYTKLYTYRWRKGTTSLELLYTTDVPDQDLGKVLVTLTTNSSFPNEIRLTPDGAAYFIRNFHGMVNTVPDYTSLVIINQSGIKEVGKILAPDMAAIKRGQFQLTCCRYFKGAYYAVVSPAEEYEYDKNAPEFRLEIVKLVP